MQKRQISIFLPDSFLSETKDLKLKTSKIGIIGRALAIFRVNKVIIYRDISSHNENQSSNQKDGDLIAKILDFMNTPQYLRKKVFPLEYDLKHVGILPPLRTPHHPKELAELGDYRQGLTVKRNKKGTFVDIGLDQLAFCKEQLTVNKIFSFKIIKFAKEIIVTPEEPDGIYWGYEMLSTHKTLKNSLKLIKPDFVIETSKLGIDITTIFNDLESKINDSKSMAILFGGPYSGVSENIESSLWDSIKLNSVPFQGTETIRTEEAVVSTLALLNVLIS
ncbi:MAG: RNA-binding protein [Methanobrevibacter sp.]|jgi:predicted SPOUT superfamily RNA methylase MTH1|nr:RNA-binding protein [Candidatus Methanoflexus mossambicus]